MIFCQKVVNWVNKNYFLRKRYTNCYPQHYNLAMSVDMYALKYNIFCVEAGWLVGKAFAVADQCSVLGIHYDILSTTKKNSWM